MEVIIDGINYIPAPQAQTDKSLESALETALETALEIRFDSDAGDNLSIRDYLYALLETLWSEGESFNSKRPFGNSGWEFDLYRLLVKNEFVKGTLDEDGCIAELDKDEADSFVFDLIKACFYGIDKY